MDQGRQVRVPQLEGRSTEPHPSLRQPTNGRRQVGAGIPLSVFRPAWLHAIDQLPTGQPVLAVQWIEGGWLLALSVLLIAVTVLLVRRRVA